MRMIMPSKTFNYIHPSRPNFSLLSLAQLSHSLVVNFNKEPFNSSQILGLYVVWLD